jgi:tRNA (guanine-N7-)-methyltransferase
VDPGLSRPYETTWEDWLLGGGARAPFADPSKPLEVEIGPGEDDFLLESALARPDRNWLGIEYSHKRVARYARKVHARSPGLANLRLIWRPAEDLVRPFLSPGVVEAYHVYFPDPWPKKHHGRYRLVDPGFLSDLATSLVPAGVVHLATDQLDYAREMLEAFAGVPVFRNLRAPPGYEVAQPTGRTTVFEDRWRAMGRPIYRLDFGTGPSPH